MVKKSYIFMTYYNAMSHIHSPCAVNNLGGNTDANIFSNMEHKTYANKILCRYLVDEDETE